MPVRRSRLARAPRFLSALAVSAWGAAAMSPALVAGTPPDPSPLAIVERSVTQEQGGWRVDYRLRHEGAATVAIAPSEIGAKVEAWVSNSRVASHAVPRLSTLTVSGESGPSASSEVIVSADETQRCRERAVVQAWAGDDPAPPAEPVAKDPARPAPVERQAPLTLAPGALVRVRLRLEHQHILYGDYDPLLGQRAVELKLGPAVLRDVVSMDREQYLAQPRSSWPAPPEDRRDPRHYVSAPDSLHLEAHVVGNRSYRFPERPVRYGTKVRLRFWYLIASGTEGGCSARILQYKDTPIAYKSLTDGTLELQLATPGRWVKVERVFRTEPEATTLALEFRICGDEAVGEMWIDDVSLEPVAAEPAGP